jgi:branched-chain amino acid transport system ATP-binding protein
MSSTGAEPVPRLEAQGVTVRFGGLVALNDVDLSVPAGAITGLVGPNGAGKSTFFAAVCGLVRPASGSVFLDGTDVSRKPPQVRAMLGLSRTFQQPELFADLNVVEHIRLAYRVHHSRSRMWSDLLTARGFRRPPADENARVEELVTMLHLDEIAYRTVGGLPLGSSRLVEMARALATDPRVLLLDEPSSGLDIRETEQLACALTGVVAEHGVSILLVEHDVDLVLGTCDYVHVLDFGAQIAQGVPAEIRSNPLVRVAYLGEDFDDSLPETKAVGEVAE